RHTRLVSDWSSDVCSSDLLVRVAKTTSIPSYVLPLSKARIASARILSTTVVLGLNPGRSRQNRTQIPNEEKPSRPPVWHPQRSPDLQVGDKPVRIQMHAPQPRAAPKAWKARLKRRGFPFYCDLHGPSCESFLVHPISPRHFVSRGASRSHIAVPFRQHQQSPGTDLYGQARFLLLHSLSPGTGLEHTRIADTDRPSISARSDARCHRPIQAIRPYPCGRQHRLWRL